MNQRIRKEAKKLIIELGKPQKEIAAELGMNPNYLNEMLNQDKSGIPKRWQQLLEYLRDNLGEKKAKESPVLTLLLDEEDRR